MYETITNRHAAVDETIGELKTGIERWIGQRN
jgi:hypothetical protein